MNRAGVVMGFLAVSLIYGAAISHAEDEKNTSVTELMYKTKLSHDPNATFDFPKDMKVTKDKGVYKVETTEHYVFRKIASQDEKLQDMSDRLDAMDDKIRKLNHEGEAGS